MKLGQLTEYNRKIFFKNYVGNETGRLVPDFFFFLKNV